MHHVVSMCPVICLYHFLARYVPVMWHLKLSRERVTQWPFKKEEVEEVSGQKQISKNQCH